MGGGLKKKVDGANTISGHGDRCKDMTPIPPPLLPDLVSTSTKIKVESIDVVNLS
jgi:hypothetical protein